MTGRRAEEIYYNDYQRYNLLYLFLLLPGLDGFVLDLIKMAWGSRLFTATLSGLGLPLPLIAHVAVQCFAIAMIRSNASLCLTQLMNDPLTTHRLRVFIYLFSGMLLPTSNVGHLLPDGSECMFIYNLLHFYFGITVPTIPLLLQTRMIADSKYTTHRFIVWWIGLIVTWAVAVLVTAYAFKTSIS